MSDLQKSQNFKRNLHIEALSAVNPKNVDSIVSITVRNGASTEQVHELIVDSSGWNCERPSSSFPAIIRRLCLEV